MQETIYQGGVQNAPKTIKLRLLLLHFQDENNVHFIYSPHLDLTGYGANLREAKKSFKIVFRDFIDYTTEHQTLETVLGRLGWKLNKDTKNVRKILEPSILSIINKNEHVSEIFDKYPINTFHKEVAFPVIA